MKSYNRICAYHIFKVRLPNNSACDLAARSSSSGVGVNTSRSSASMASASKFQSMFNQNQKRLERNVQCIKGYSTVSKVLKNCMWSRVEISLVSFPPTLLLSCLVLSRHVYIITYSKSDGILKYPIFLHQSACSRCYSSLKMHNCHNFCEGPLARSLWEKPVIYLFYINVVRSLVFSVKNTGKISSWDLLTAVQRWLHVETNTGMLPTKTSTGDLYKGVILSWKSIGSRQNTTQSSPNSMLPHHTGARPEAFRRRHLTYARTSIYFDPRRSPLLWFLRLSFWDLMLGPKMSQTLPVRALWVTGCIAGNTSCSFVSAGPGEETSSFIKSSLVMSMASRWARNMQDPGLCTNTFPILWWINHSNLWFCSESWSEKASNCVSNTATTDQKAQQSGLTRLLLPNAWSMRFHSIVPLGVKLFATYSSSWQHTPGN